MLSPKSLFTLPICLLIGPLMLQGCSTYSKTECENMNWSQKGYDAALAGRKNAGAFAHYRRECGQEHGVEPVASQFKTGYDLGLQEFCSPKRALEFGRAGGTYAGVCPENLEDKFLPRYQMGKTEFLEQELERLRHQVSSLKSQISDKDSQINSLQSEVSRLRSQPAPICPNH